jgi:hypothetical protein
MTKENVMFETLIQVGLFTAAIGLNLLIYVAGGAIIKDWWSEDNFLVFCGVSWLLVGIGCSLILIWVSTLPFIPLV